MNIVDSITVTLIRVFRTRFTDPWAVLPGGKFLLVTICLMPLIIMTVLLINKLTVSITLNTASAPTEKLKVVRMVKAFSNIIGMVTAGTNAVWKPRRNRHTIRNMRTTVLISAPIILRTETPMNGAALHGQITPRFDGKNGLTPVSLVWTVVVALSVPVLAVSPTFRLEVGRLPNLVTTLQPLLFSLTPVILCSSMWELLRPIPSRTPLNLLAEARCARVTTEVPSRRFPIGGALLSRFVVIRVPRVPTVATILIGASRNPPSLPGPT